MTKELSYSDFLQLPVGTRVEYRSLVGRTKHSSCIGVVSEPQDDGATNTLVGRLRLEEKNGRQIGYANIWESNGDHTGVFALAETS